MEKHNCNMQMILLWVQIWKYQPWMKTMLLGVLRTLEGAEKPTIAIHVKAHGSTPVQVSPMQCICTVLCAESEHIFVASYRAQGVVTTPNRIIPVAV